METISIDKHRSDGEIYSALYPQLDSLINADEPILSGLMNFTSALKDSLEKISWIGFYIRSDDKLYLGPFQGKPACTVIKIGNGVCGKAAAERKTIIVEDVDKFPGHIACDAGSRSEIVVPIIIDNSLWGVLDVDSYRYSAFDSTDARHLEIFLGLLTNRFDLSLFQIKNNSDIS